MKNAKETHWTLKSGGGNISAFFSFLMYNFRSKGEKEKEKTSKEKKHRKF
jgi:hypothetical protein